MSHTARLSARLGNVKLETMKGCVALLLLNPTHQVPSYLDEFTWRESSPQTSLHKYHEIAAQQLAILFLDQQWLYTYHGIYICSYIFSCTVM